MMMNQVKHHRSLQTKRSGGDKASAKLFMKQAQSISGFQ